MFQLILLPTLPGMNRVFEPFLDGMARASGWKWKLSQPTHWYT